METATACPTSTATILACQKIAKAFKENIYELSSIWKDWDPEYAESFYEWIDNTIGKFYTESLDSIEDPKYRDWHDVMAAGLQSIKVLRASMKVDFKHNKPFLKEIFSTLGYDDYFSDAKNGDHMSLYKLLRTFTQNLDEETKQLLCRKGIPESLFNKVFETAAHIEEFKCCIDALENENNLNTLGVKEVADIYEITQDICRIATAYYHFDPVLRDEFNFYKVMINL